MGYTQPEYIFTLFLGVLMLTAVDWIAGIPMQPWHSTGRWQ